MSSLSFFLRVGEGVFFVVGVPFYYTCEVKLIQRVVVWVGEAGPRKTARVMGGASSIEEDPRTFVELNWVRYATGLKQKDLDEWYELESGFFATILDAVRRGVSASDVSGKLGAFFDRASRAVVGKAANRAFKPIRQSLEARIVPSASVFAEAASQVPKEILGIVATQARNQVGAFLSDAEEHNEMTFQDFRDVWEVFSDSDKTALLDDLDQRVSGGHSFFQEKTSYRAFMAEFGRGEPAYLSLWMKNVVDAVREVFLSTTRMQEVIERLGKKRVAEILPVRNSNPEAPRLKLRKSLAIAGDQVVWSAVDTRTGKFWVVKWAEDVVREEENWLRLGREGGAIPELSLGYHFFGMHLLVVERLFPLSSDDDEYRIMAQVIGGQLRYLHKFAVHSDIKPDNILKRVYEDDDRPPDYFLIDFDLTTQRRGRPDGFSRTLFTPLWASQQQTPSPVITWFHDVLETLFTGNGLGLLRQYDLGVGAYGPDKLTGIYPAAGVVKRGKANLRDEEWLKSDAYSDPITFLRYGGADRNDRRRFQYVETQAKAVNLPPPWGAFGIQQAYLVLTSLPQAHPAPGTSDDAVYDALVEAIESVRTFRREDRAGWQPGTRKEGTDEFVGGCWACGRAQHKVLKHKLFRESGGRRSFCGKTCQRHFHEAIHLREAHRRSGPEKDGADVL